MDRRRRTGAAGFVLLVSWSLLCAGCGEEPLREDRRMQWSPDAKRLAFHELSAGTFVANVDGGDVVQIHRSEQEVIAISAPNWSPDGRQLIFATARAAGAPDGGATDGGVAGPPNDAAVPRDPAEQPWSAWCLEPEGRLFYKRDTAYRCWLADVTPAGSGQPPVALFHATCDHPAYVAADRAVHWLDNRRVLYVDRVGQTQHGLFQFDLVSAAKTRRLPHAADALWMGVAPGGQFVGCLLASRQQAGPQDGIWVARVDRWQWWRVPESERAVHADGPSPLERLGRARPVWTPSGEQFAFVERGGDEGAQRTVIRLVDADQRQISELWHGAEPVRDLHWDPQGGQLGFLVAGQTPRIQVVDLRGQPTNELALAQLERFVGWDPRGRDMALTTMDDVSPAGQRNWAFLLIPDAHPRDRLWIVPAEHPQDARERFAGMRLAFPDWSPAGGELALWATFLPVRHSLFSILGNWGLQPGDPPLVLEADGNDTTWLVRRAEEIVQVGHYWLRAGDARQAWTWYRRAAAAADTDNRLPALQPVFEAVCLARLGRAPQARQRLARFRRACRPDLRAWIDWAASDCDTTDAQSRTLLDNEAARILLPLMQDLWIAEVYLSLDAGDEALALFRARFAEARSDEMRLGRAVVLAQLLLVTQHPSEYADLVRDDLAPLLLRLKPTYPDGLPTDPQTVEDLRRQAWACLGALVLLPLCSETFQSQLDADQVRRQLAAWNAFSAAARDPVESLAADLVLRAAQQRLAATTELESVLQRLLANPVLEPMLGEAGLEGLDETVQQWSETRWNSPP